MTKLVNTYTTRAFDVVIGERIHQIADEGFREERDDSLDPGVLSSAGASYALHACDVLHPMSQGDGGFKDTPPSSWPFDRSWWKPTTPVRDLAKAAALILAEIEKLIRHEDQTPVPMVLHCPECGEQHIDKPEEFMPMDRCTCAGPDTCETCDSNRAAFEEWLSEGPWLNPPHRTHQCQKCKHEWRPFEYATTGVATEAETGLPVVEPDNRAATDAWAAGADFALHAIGLNDLCFVSEQMRDAAVMRAAAECLAEKARRAAAPEGQG